MFTLFMSHEQCKRRWVNKNKKKKKTKNVDSVKTQTSIQTELQKKTLAIELNSPFEVLLRRFKGQLFSCMQKCFGLFLHLTKNFKTAFAPKLCWSSPYLLILTKLCGCISRQIIYEHLGSAKSTREIRLLLKSQQNRALLMCPFVNLFDK